MKRLNLIVFAIAGAIVIYSCNKKNAETDPSLSSDVSLDLPQQTAVYFENANQQLNEKATLGRVLFYDGRLSVNNAISCASCHKQAFAFADNVQFSRGFENKLTGRNSPAIQNIFGPNITNIQNFRTFPVALFWDGRENNLQDLISRPISNHVEMGMDNPESIVEKLEALPYYKGLFKAAYKDETISFDRISECMSLFISAINSTNSRSDKAQKGEITLSALEEYGKSLFLTKYECTRCHASSPGGYLSLGGGARFFNIGLEANPYDKGRGIISRIPGDMGSFKIPQLTNVALTAPYMHDGRFKTLEEVLDHYSKGIADDPNLSEELRDDKGHPIKMNISDNEKKALVAFLNTFTDYEMLTDAKFSNPFKAN